MHCPAHYDAQYRAHYCNDLKVVVVVQTTNEIHPSLHCDDFVVNTGVLVCSAVAMVVVAVVVLLVVGGGIHRCSTAVDPVTVVVVAMVVAVHLTDGSVAVVELWGGWGVGGGWLAQTVGAIVWRKRRGRRRRGGLEKAGLVVVIWIGIGNNPFDVPPPHLLFVHFAHLVATVIVNENNLAGVGGGGEAVLCGCWVIPGGDVVHRHLQQRCPNQIVSLNVMFFSSLRRLPLVRLIL